MFKINILVPLFSLLNVIGDSDALITSSSSSQQQFWQNIGVIADKALFKLFFSLGIFTVGISIITNKRVNKNFLFHNIVIIITFNLRSKYSYNTQQGQQKSLLKFHPGGNDHTHTRYYMCVYASANNTNMNSKFGKLWIFDLEFIGFASGADRERERQKKRSHSPSASFFSFSTNLMFYYSIEALLCRRCSSGWRSKQRFAIKRCIVLLFCETKVVTKHNTCLLRHTHVTSIVSLFSHVTCVKSLFVQKVCGEFRYTFLRKASIKFFVSLHSAMQWW